MLLEFFEEHIQDRFPEDNYTFDVYITTAGKVCALIALAASKPLISRHADSTASADISCSGCHTLRRLADETSADPITLFIIALISRD